MPAPLSARQPAAPPATGAMRLAASAALLGLGLAGCVAAKSSAPEVAMMAAAQQNNIMPASQMEREAADRTDLLTQAAFWNKEYDKNPNDHEAALKLARALRAIGSSSRAAEIAGQSLALRPGDAEMTLVYAQASLDMGKPGAAASALAQAEANAQGDWRLLSIIGVVMDQLGRHPAAQDYYTRALALSPDNSRILSNLGLSYVLEGKAPLAEETLRRAAALPDPDPRVHQNLVLVLGVQGKFDEAARLAGPETPKVVLDSNTEYFRALLSPARSWDALRGAQN